MVLVLGCFGVLCSGFVSTIDFRLYLSLFLEGGLSSGPLPRDLT